MLSTIPAGVIAVMVIVALIVVRAVLVTAARVAALAIVWSVTVHRARIVSITTASIDNARGKNEAQQ